VRAVKLRKPLGATALVLATAGLVWVIALRPAPEPPMQRKPESAKEQLPPPPPEPTFTSPEQTRKYYGTLLDGERRALAAVESALGGARSNDPDRGYVMRLESLRTEYQQRIERHQAVLAAR
jgi:hypothetical protein